MGDHPYFLWSEGEQISEAELRKRVRSDDPATRALWMGRILREATFNEVWTYVSIEQVLRDWDLVERHMGRMRPFWKFMMDGWRYLGPIPAVLSSRDAHEDHWQDDDGEMRATFS